MTEPTTTTHSLTATNAVTNTNPTVGESTRAIIDRHDRCMSINYGRFPVAMVRGEGATLWDAEGKSYLDLFAGFGAPVLGHCHPDLVRAVGEQAQRLWHVGNLFHTEPQTRAAEAIHKHSGGMVSFFSHSGADANEAAIKLARLYGKARRGSSKSPWGRYKIISTTRSFHGRSFATMGATGNAAVRDGFEPLPEGFINVDYNDIGVIEMAADEDAVAVIAEPIQGEGGVNVPDSDYFARLRALCDERDMLLIADEVWTGCGRTGEVFAHRHWFPRGGAATGTGDSDANGGGRSAAGPDIMTLGKGVGGGLAVGVMAARPEVAELYNAKTQGKVRHATTLGGNCLSMAVTATIFEVLERDGLCGHAARLGHLAIDRLSAYGRRSGLIAEVRGLGLFLGVQLNTDHPEAWFNRGEHAVSAGGQPGPAVVKAALARDPGLCLNAAQGSVIRLAPPLTIGEEQWTAGLDALIDTLEAAPA